VHLDEDQLLGGGVSLIASCSNGGNAGDVPDLAVVDDGVVDATALFDSLVAAQQDAGSYHFELTEISVDDTDLLAVEGAAVFGGDTAPDQAFTLLRPSGDKLTEVRILNRTVYTDVLSLSKPNPKFVRFDADQEVAIRAVMGPRFDNYYAHADVITSLANHADHLTITVGNHSNEDDGEPVTVDAPPAKDIIDIEEALAEIGADFEKG
jgi:hypothetical protein